MFFTLMDHAFGIMPNNFVQIPDAAHFLPYFLLKTTLSEF